MAGTGLLLSALSIFVLFFYLCILVLPVVLLVALQVWLCRKSVKLGLILPAISLALSLLLALSLAGFGIGGGHVVTGGANYAGPNGQEVPAQPEITERIDVDFNVNMLLPAGLLFLAANVPTAVFGGIWLHYKGRRDTLEDLKKMRIEDLG